MRNRYLVSSLLVGVTFLIAFGLTGSSLKQEYELWRLNKERAAYRAFLHNHPFNQRPAMTKEQLKQIPKRDRPDLAAELRFLQTADPRTRMVPIERLFAANELVDEAKRRMGGGPLMAAPGDPTLVTMPWEERGPNNIGGRTRAIMFDPNDPTARKVWAGGVAGGLWYTDDITDPFAPWHSVDDFWANLAVSAIAYDPSNTNVFYVGTGEGVFNADAVQGGGIFKSVDGGATWERLMSTTDPSFYYVQKIVVTDQGTVLAATRDGAGVQRSDDGGQTWTIALNSSKGTVTNRAADLEIGADGRIYASMGLFSQGSIWVSENDGVDWTRLSTPASGFPTTANVARIELATAPSDPNVLYAIAHDMLLDGSGADVLGIYRSEDQGVTWQQLTEPVDCSHPTSDFSRGQAWYDLILAVNPTDPNDVIVGTIDLFRSTDPDAPEGANTWTQISVWHSFYTQPQYCGATVPVVHADQHAIVFRPGTTAAVFGHDGGIDYSPDVTATPQVFINRNNGYNVTQFYSAALTPEPGGDFMLGGTQDNGTQYFSAPGINATLDVIGGDGGFSFIDQTNPGIAIGTYVYNNIYRSVNGGPFEPILAFNGGLFINPMDYDDEENILYSTKFYDQLFRCTDMEGAVPTCAQLNINLEGDFSTAIRTSHLSNAIFIGTSTGLIFRVDDADGIPVPTDITGNLNPGYVSSIEIGADEQQLLVTLSNYGVTSIYETTDGGATWEAKEGDLPDIPVNWALYNPFDRTAALIATDAGLFETVNLDAASPNWTPVPTTPTTRFDMLQHRADGTVLAASHGRGMWTSSWRTEPLPVELAAFTAVGDAGAVRLSWSTLSETNNAGFNVEMRRGAEGAFEKIGFVEGAGTTQEARTYTFRHEGLAPGIYAFRLQQIDFDGASEYSPIVETTVGVPGTHALSSFYPNPFNPRTSFKLTLARTQQVSIEAFDVLGRRVALLHEGELTGAQEHTFQFDAAALPSGQYLVRVTGEQFVETRSVMLVK